MWEPTYSPEGTLTSERTVPGRREARGGAARAAESRVIVVSNRLPVRIVTQDGHVVLRRSDGGLASAMRKPHADHGGLWIGWPGDLPTGTPDARRDLLREFTRQSTVPVVLDAEEIDGFYRRIANGVLWPVCHDRLDRLPLRVEGWDVYERVNRKFADAVVEHWREGDLIWVHDYQLFLVPEMIRARIPSARIGFFLHIPFPNPEIFFTLGSREAIVEGMMGADLVGFHTRRYRGHFTAALRRLFDLEMEADATVAWRGRRVGLGAFPIGIDAAGFATRAANHAVLDHPVMRRWPAERVVMGVDRLDYTKGISRRLLAIERLLLDHPEWRERLRFIQVAVPSRGEVAAYQSFREEVEALVGRINGAFSTATWSPIHYMHRSVTEQDLAALYRRADVMLVTPLRDGMNLVAKEYVASRIYDDGALVLSQFTGAADELTEALMVNPYDVDGTAAILHQALILPAEEQRRRMRAMRDQVFHNTTDRWSAAYLDALASCEP